MIKVSYIRYQTGDEIGYWHVTTIKTIQEFVKFLGKPEQF